MDFAHIPVLVEETIAVLRIESGKRFIDGTIGGGGHAKRVLALGGKVLGIDKDEEALASTREKLSDYIENQSLTLVKGDFSNISEIARSKRFTEIDGILLDLGVSSHQFDSRSRGFSLRHDSKLDMRMDQKQELSAFEVVNGYSKDRLVDIFLKFGEEANSVKIAEAIIDARRSGDIQTTKELVNLIERIPHKNEPIHPATRVFQALRIEVNDELSALRKGLEQGIELLGQNGRFAVISFHSLEDRIVKQTFAKWERERKGRVLQKKPVVAGLLENANNRRARSAKLRVFEKN